MTEKKHKIKSLNELVDFIRRNKGHFAFLVGAGTSRAAGIPTANELIEEWRREKYKKEGGDKKSNKKFKEWVKEKEKEIGVEESKYGFWFEQICPTRGERREFIRKLVEGKEPSFGIIVLASMMAKRYCRVTLTPNFDDLLYDTFYLFLEEKPLLINHDALAPEIRFTEDRPTIIKLHGDYLYDNLQNIGEETKRLSENMKITLNSCLKEYGLIVVGYGGNDKSIMGVLKDANPSYGIWWCTRNKKNLSNRAKELLKKENTFLVEIEGSEELFTILWRELNIPIPEPSEIKKRAEERAEKLKEKIGERKKEVKGEEKKALEKWLEFVNFMDKGSALYEQGKYKEAIKCYDKAIEINPKDADAWNNKGVTLAKQGKYKEALECFNKAIEIDPKDAVVWNNKGSVLAEQGKYKEAIKCYDKAIEIDPKDADAWNNKGNALAKQGKYKEAIKCYDKAIEIDPEYARAYQHLSEISIITGKIADSLKYAEESLKYSKSKDGIAVALMLSIIAKTLAGRKVTEEDRYKKICSEDFITRWDFEILDSWLERTKISSKKKNYITEIMSLLKAHKSAR